jgi:DUF4097 and DUF4098 domain-containing protein YvlB
MRNRITTSAGAILLLAVCTGFLAIAADKHFEKKFPGLPGGTLTLTTDVGSVTVTGSSTNEVAIVADLLGRSRDVEGFAISAEESAKGVEVTGRQRRGGGWFWNSSDLDVRFTVAVPHDFSLQLHTSGGDMTITDVKGKIGGETSGGNLIVTGTEGEVKLETSGGNIRAERIIGDLTMGTSGGDIVLSSAKGNVDVSTSGGNIRITDADGKIRAETSGGNVTVKAIDGGKGIYAETSGGNIDIMVKKTIAATLDDRQDR